MYICITYHYTLCLELTCRPLEEPDNGTIACTRSGFVIGDVCTVRCDDGFDLIGSATRICLGNQTWSGTEATCLPGKFHHIFLYVDTQSSDRTCICLLI